MCMYDGFDMLIQYYLNRGPRFSAKEMEMYSTIKNSQMHKAQPKTLSLNPKASCFHSRVHYNTRISYMSLLENGCRKTKNIPIKFCH